MSEAEAFEMFTLIGDRIEQLFYGYFSLVTAFLAMTYLAAEKLDRIFSTIVLCFYTLCCAWFFLSVYAWRNDALALYAEMLSKKESGVYELTWFGTNPDWMSIVNTGLQVALILGGWLVSAGYFVYLRRQAKKGEGT